MPPASDTVVANNDVIQLGSFTVNSASLSGTSLTVDTTGGTYNLTLSAPHLGAFVDWSGSDVFLSTVACFLRGTLRQIPALSPACGVRGGVLQCRVNSAVRAY